MINSYSFNRKFQRSIIFLIGILIITTLGGCEPLRKKFIRKKKGDKQEKEFVPVLDPIDYPDRIETPEQKYAQHYSLWRAWVKDLLLEFGEERRNDKRIIYDLNRIWMHLDEMQKRLMKEKQKKLQDYMRSIQRMLDEMNQTQRLRNNYGMRSKVLRMEKDLRNNFKPDQLEGSFVSAVED